MEGRIPVLERRENSSQLSRPRPRSPSNAFDYLDAPVLRVTAPDCPVPYSPPLEEAFLPQAADVMEAVRRLMAY